MFSGVALRPSDQIAPSANGRRLTAPKRQRLGSVRGIQRAFIAENAHKCGSPTLHLQGKMLWLADFPGDSGRTVQRISRQSKAATHISNKRALYLSHLNHQSAYSGLACPLQDPHSGRRKAYQACPSRGQKRVQSRHGTQVDRRRPPNQIRLKTIARISNVDKDIPH